MSYSSPSFIFPLFECIAKIETIENFFSWIQNTNAKSSNVDIEVVDSHSYGSLVYKERPSECPSKRYGTIKLKREKEFSICHFFVRGKLNFFHLVIGSFNQRSASSLI
ncbi:hypothetical protein BpHYR1_025364 [Brachionus plicatilis]|uniref:Uncharacterized protein n=1 Tax=Brachionus plicatilis TaxID=10195 RepID=A0A3M7PNC7_BRAPC|nr:hypothetical protein BpHYR1_025364 [Brachionus plicatilis]